METPTIVKILESHRVYHGRCIGVSSCVGIDQDGRRWAFELEFYNMPDRPDFRGPVYRNFRAVDDATAEGDE